MVERILVVAHGHPEISPGGAELAAYNLFRALRQTPGVEAYFLAWAGPSRQAHGGTPFGSFRDRADEILFSVDQFDHFLFSQPTDVLDQFALLLARIAPDILHMHHYSRIGLEFIALARRHNPRMRIILTLHEYLAICNNYGQRVKTRSGVLCHEAHPYDCAACFPQVQPADFLLRKLFIRAHFEKVDLFIAPSEFLRQRYIAWGLPGWQIVTLENGIGRVRPVPPRTRLPTERRGIFGFFGQINPFKGLTQLLAAFDHIGQASLAASSGMRLMVHGANLEHGAPEFIEQITRLLTRNAARVHFAGPYEPSNLGRLMAAVDWVVVPSTWWENSPLVIQEAYAHRRPVICADIGGMAEKVTVGQDGFHFQVGNPFDLAALMLRLAGEVGTWERLQQTIRQPLWIEEWARRHLELYRDRTFTVADEVARAPELAAE